MKRLLVATDLSVNALQLATYAYRLAQILQADLLLCHTINVPAEVPQSGTVAWPQAVYEDMEYDSRAELLKLKEEVIAAGDRQGYQPGIDCIQGAGLVTGVVNAEAVQHKADLLIIGAHANDRLGTWLIGNHARKLIETAVCPLLLIPAGAEFRPIKRIGVGSDFEQPGLELQAMDQLIKLSKIWNAELILAHIQTNKQLIRDNSIIKGLLMDLMRDHGHQHVHVKVVNSDHVANGLEWLVRHAHIDLLAMVHQQHGFFDQLFHGSHTLRVAAHLPVPLLVFNTLKHEN